MCVGRRRKQQLGCHVGDVYGASSTHRFQALELSAEEGRGETLNEVEAASAALRSPIGMGATAGRT